MLRLHGLLRSITSKLLCNFSYNPQMDGKAKVVNWSLGNFLKILSGEKPEQWDLVLAQVEFIYSDSINWYVGKSIF